MKGINTWNYTPYLPADRWQESKNPLICRLAPAKSNCEVQWLGEGDFFTLHYSVRFRREWHTVMVQAHTFRLQDLEMDTEYELFVTDAQKRKSPVRLLRTGEITGTVVNYLHPEDTQYGFSGQYLCSPSILKLPGGSLLASMDVFGHGTPQNLSLLFRSDDNGVTWNYITDIFPCFWGKLFWHHNQLYILGVSCEYGDLLIGASDDEGYTWGAPTVIRRGSASTLENGNHRAPTVLLNSHGRLWTGTEYGSWGKNFFASSLLSIAENADLLESKNWTFTDFIRPDAQQFCGEADIKPGGIEGNALELPDGTVIDLLRFQDGKALVMEADWTSPEAALTLKEILDFPIANTKFEVARHENGLYYALGNPSPGRNVLSLYASRDVSHWHKVKDIINHSEYDKDQVGFQYPSFCFDKNEMLILSRTAWNGAHNFHDSNYITFHRTTLF